MAKIVRPKGPDVLAKVSVPTVDLTLGEMQASKSPQIGSDLKGGLASIDERRKVL